MKEIKTDISFLKQEAVLEKLTWKNKYAFACWRYPNELHSRLIISLSKPKQLKSELHESPTGFIANSFKDNHPVNPWLIPADLTIGADGEVTIGQDVSSTLVEEFLNYLESVKKPNNITLIDKVSEGMNDSDFLTFVGEIIAQIKNQQAIKIVPSRYQDVKLKSENNYSELFGNMCLSYPSAFCNMWSLADGEIWAGATPESFLSFENNIFSTVALAGTQRIDEGDQLSNVAWTQKEIEEQALVSRFIINCFKKLRIREFEEYGPKTIRAGNLAHLCTTFEVDLSKVHFEKLADQMMELLHPTSAVCGMPREETAKFLEMNEGYDRSFYAGFIGTVNFQSATKLFVNLRCVKFTENIVRFYAGAGVTEDSIPEKELTEIEMKMDVMKRMIL